MYFHIIGELEDFRMKRFETVGVFVVCLFCHLKLYSSPPLGIIQWVQTSKEILMHSRVLRYPSSLPFLLLCSDRIHGCCRGKMSSYQLKTDQCKLNTCVPI